MTRPLKSHILTLMAAATLLTAACEEDNGIMPGGDIRTPKPAGQAEPADAADSLLAIARLDTLWQGDPDGFVVTIMSEGYTAAQLAQGLFARDARKAADALFKLPPMDRLKRHFTVYALSVPSATSDIRADRPSDTAFRTQTDPETTGVEGDTETAADMHLRIAAPRHDPAATHSTERLKRLHTRSLVVVLLNTAHYCGVTHISYYTAAPDTVPRAFALSYVPTHPQHRAAPDVEKLAADLVMHEAVGHGIGLLADEYAYNDHTAPTAEEARALQRQQQYGMNANVVYRPQWSADTMPIEPGHTLYPFAHSARYRREDIRWHRGAYEFYTQMYRPSAHSLMNSVLVARQERFNLAARIAIHSRVMHALHGDSWRFDQQEFYQLDQPNQDIEEGEATSPDEQEPTIQLEIRMEPMRTAQEPTRSPSSAIRDEGPQEPTRSPSSAIRDEGPRHAHPRIRPIE